MFLVYGASGFLGSALANELAQNSKVVAVVRKTSDTWRLVQSDNLKVVKAHESEWPDLISKLKPKIIICAQWAGVEKKERNNSRIQDENVAAIMKIAKVAVQEKCEKFIAFGSQAETSESEELIPETFLRDSSSVYGQAKSRLAISLYALFLHTQTEFIWARVFSIYGPLETRDGLIPSLLKSMSDTKSFTIREPSKSWSFLFIDDFVRAIQVLIESGVSYPVVNIGNSKLTTIFEICKTIDNESQFLGDLDSQNRKGFFPSVERLQELGWNPQVELSQGCAISIVGIRQRLSAKVP
jgi:nucleoside-diphosphate-sugar epimerase